MSDKLEASINREILRIFSKSTRLQRVINSILGEHETERFKFSPFFSGDPTQRYLTVIINEYFGKEFEFTYGSTIEFEEGSIPDLLCRRKTKFSDRLDKRISLEHNLPPVTIEEIDAFLNGKIITSTDEYAVFSRGPDHSYEIVSTPTGVKGHKLYGNRFQDPRSQLNLNLTRKTDAQIANEIMYHLKFN